MNRYSTAFALAAMTAAGLFANQTTAQGYHVDEAVFTPFGANCGADLTATDTIGRGHNLRFETSTRVANSKGSPLRTTRSASRPGSIRPIGASTDSRSAAPPRDRPRSRRPGRPLSCTVRPGPA